MGLWRLLARLVKVSPEETWLITDEAAGRLIFEEYDSSVRKSSAKSRFFEVKFGKLHARKTGDDADVVGVVELNLADADMAVEMLDD